MLLADWRVDYFRRAFLRPAPRQYALMLAPAEAQHLGQKYIGRRGAISDTMIAHHLHGAIALAAPAAVDGRAVATLGCRRRRYRRDPGADCRGSAPKAVGVRAV